MSNASRATAQRDRAREAQQAKSAGSRRSTRGQDPEAIAHSVSQAVEKALFISFPEPVDNDRWEAAAKYAAQPPPQPQITARAQVILDVALAQLPVGQRIVVVNDDPTQMREHLAFCMGVGGWAAVKESHTRLYQQGSFTVANASYTQAKSLVDDISGQLEQVQSRAQSIMKARISSSAVQLRTAAQTFLTGPEPNLPKVLETIDLRKLKGIRQRLMLAPGEHRDALDGLLKDLERLNGDVARARVRLKGTQSVKMEYRGKQAAVAEASAEVSKALTARALRVRRDSARWPLLAWLTDLNENVDDDVLLDRIVDELVVVATAQTAALEQAASGMEWPKLGQGTPEQLNRWIKAPSVGFEDLGENPFTRNMRSPRGPWRYPLVIAAALDELGYSAPDPVAAAANEAMGGATALGLVVMLSGGLATLSCVFPKIGIVVGATLAVWNLMEELDEKELKSAGYRAVLDPAKSLAVKPSIAGVMAGVIGVAGSFAPGWSGFALGMAEAAVSITTEP